MVSCCSSTSGHKRHWIVYQLQILEEGPGTPPQAHTGGSRADRERQDVGHMPLLGSLGAVLPRLRPDWSIQIKRGRSWLCSTVVSSLRVQGKALEAGETWSQEGLRNLMLSCSCLSLKPLQAAWPNNMGAKAAIPWSSWAKLLSERHCDKTHICPFFLLFQRHPWVRKDCWILADYKLSY